MTRPHRRTRGTPLLAFAVVLMLFAACGGGSENVDPAESSSPLVISAIPDQDPEVLARISVGDRDQETVIVGLVGAGGLGRLLAEQNASFDFSGILGTVLAYVVLSLAVDVTSAAVRQSIR